MQSESVTQPGLCEPFRSERGAAPGLHNDIADSVADVREWSKHQQTPGGALGMRDGLEEAAPVLPAA
eukprot:5355795-Lingulodinium_polyedra.AAC.1